LTSCVFRCREEVKESEVAALEREWEAIARRVEALRTAVSRLQDKLAPRKICKVDVTIFADPARPPHSLITLVNMLDEKAGVQKSSHCHSSLSAPVPDALKHVFGRAKPQPSDNRVSLIWKTGQVELVASPVSGVQIKGEANVVRFLSRALEAAGQCPWYEGLGAELSGEVDAWLDRGHAHLVHGDASLLGTLDAHLADREWLVGGGLSPADLFLVSVLADSPSRRPKNVEKWFQRCLRLKISAVQAIAK